jgi:hypothetical protein
MSREAQMSVARSPQEQADRCVDVLRFLTPDLVDFLADLHEAPASLAQATVQLLPFGSRSALVATGLAMTSGTSDDVSEHGRLQLTPLCFAVMAEAAAGRERQEISRLASRARTVASYLTGSG